MGEQTSDTVLMVRPARFGFDAETAASNAFQRADAGIGDAEARALGVEEFDRVVSALEGCGVRVLVLDDTPEPVRPDAVFPNNWFSTHVVRGDDGGERGVMVVYPMATPMRRAERRVGDVAAVLRSGGFAVDEVVDLTGLEDEGRALEGTGSMVLDRAGGWAFACRSARTDEAAVRDWASRMGMGAVVFDAVDGRGMPLYHTNVLMWIGRSVAAIGAGCVSEGQRGEVVGALRSGGREVVELGSAQVERFAGNALELRTGSGGAVVVMSGAARASLERGQLAAIERHAEVVAIDIPTIEALGGGSVRCMIAEVFLPRRGG
ncbi:MAG: arginine deiminase-related protein [Phycisphaerales bacterium]